ncbi:ras GTPase-activating protein-binding protein 1-like [Hydractinia symbiolongicarpus]|uniref:ras GTPase-activating protein-binding protein 1-like n=1 Tax=Hydractinia symbiolongicarpus TaxID=13093 RepID=UPI00254AC0C0|nr:ras GTPase-activating protein-binding protein 1-like [Hydractinia symbiolongicarpus]
MVMAQLPNTQYVAHEFVRQYYTMLHKDPSQLHRFYTRESRLTHGVSPNAKSEDPVCGQEAINDKISQLHFRNCHAKIRSVDSHPTIGGGVVIQVTGELSNAGMPMRKFMQTFVLAQQEPKKYNVFNDIFRYQDETFEDTENDETVDGTVESENGYQNHDPAGMVGQMDTIPDNETEVPAVDAASAIPLVNDDHFNDDHFQYVPNAPAQTTEENADAYAEDDRLQEDSDEFAKPAEEDYPVSKSVDDQVEQSHEASASDEQEAKEDDGTEFKEYEDVQVDETTEAANKPTEPDANESSKPVTWAALAKKNTTSTSANSSPVSKPAPKKPVQTQQRPKKREEAPVTKKETPEEPRRRGAAPDSHQIFIGNLPVTVTEKDVREAFKEYGTIVEVRLNPKNFGFVAFTGPEAPTTILQNKTKQIVIHNHTINTEEKRSVSGSGRGGGGGGSGGGGGGFRRGDRDSARGRNDQNKNRTGSGQNRSGRNTTYTQKQSRSGDDNKTERNKDQKAPREQKQSKR